MITIKDIAKMAGVGKSTVSRVINGSGYVSEDTRQKVEKIIEEYNYLPSAPARNLSKQTSDAIGVIIPGITNPFFEEILFGISEIIDETGMTMYFFYSGNSVEKEERALKNLKEQRVRGLIMSPTIDYSEKNALRRLKGLLNDLQIPVVLFDRPIEHSMWDGVYFDGYNGSYQAVQALIEEGHKKIGIITGDMSIRISRDRFQGYAQALKDYDMQVDPRYIYKGDFTADTAYRLTKACLEGNDIPDAVFTCNNMSTVGFLKALKERKMEIGRDIGCIGFDFVPIIDMLGIHLSYVGRDDNMGTIAAKMLLERMKNPSTPRREYNIPAKIVLRGSEKKNT